MFNFKIILVVLTARVFFMLLNFELFFTLLIYHRLQTDVTLPYGNSADNFKGVKLNRVENLNGQKATFILI